MSVVAAPRRAGVPVRYRVVAFTVSLAALTEAGSLQMGIETTRD